MGSVILVSGCPGSGKTTLSRALAESHAPGLHLVSDLFYGFIPNAIDPATPESREQNHTIMRALGACAAQFAEGGYDVFLDGVVGPWMLPLLRPFLAPLDTTRYVVLRVSLDEALARVTDREGSSALSPTVRHMHEQLSDLGPFEPHAVDGASAGPEELARHVASRLASGELDIDWSRVPD